jgi:hypothetical protein
MPTSVQKSFSAPVGGRVHFVVYDTAIRGIDFLEAACRLGWLLTVVIDECHQVLLAQFREVMHHMNILSVLNVPFVLMSGTLPTPLQAPLLQQFGLNPYETITFTTRETFDKRLIVNLIDMGQDVTEKQLFQYQLKLIQHELAANADAKHRILVFFMSKKLMEKQAELLKSEQVQSKLLTISADDGEESLDLFFREFDEYDGPLIVFSTSFTAEGMNFPRPVDMVIVSMGTYGGVLVLDQMFNRAGRGLDSFGSTRLPQVILLFSNTLIRRTLYQNTQALMDEEDRKVFAPIIGSEHTQIDRLVGFCSLRKLFETISSAEGSVCCSRVLESAINNTPMEEMSCNFCVGCLSESWEYPAPPNRPKVSRVFTTQSWKNSVEQADLQTSNTASGTAWAGGDVGSSTSSKKRVRVEMQKPGMSCPAQTIDLLNQIEVNGMQFLNDYFKSCPLCGKRDKPHHFSDTCSELVGLTELIGSRPRCKVCLSGDHVYPAVQDWLGQKYQNLPREDDTQNWGQHKGNIDKRQRCRCMILAQDNHDICDVCWLTHDDPQACIAPRYLIRSLALYVWHHRIHRDAFFRHEVCGPSTFKVNEINAHIDAEARTSHSSPKAFHVYAHWVMYESEKGLRNIWRVVHYMKMVIEKDFKKQMGNE